VSCQIVLTTAPNLKEARQIASVLLDSKLAACVTILPGAESHYHWRAKRERSKEFVLLIKSRAKLFDRIRKTIQKNHTYDVPEILALSVSKGSPDYLAWLKQETSSSF